MYLKTNCKEVKEIKLEYSCYITIDPKAAEEMLYYVKEFDGECSGCGLVELREHKLKDDTTEYEYFVSEIFLPVKQDNTAASTEIDAPAIHELMTQLIQDGKDTSKLRFHWHSHANMEVFHSSIDTDNYEDLKTGDWLISIVANKSHDFFGRLDIYKPFRLSYSGVPVYISTPETGLDTVKLDESIKKVKEHNTPKMAYQSYGLYKAHEYEGFDTVHTGYEQQYSMFGGGTAKDIDIVDIFSTLESMGFIILYDNTKMPVGIYDYDKKKVFELKIDSLSEYYANQLYGGNGNVPFNQTIQIGG